MSSHNSSSRQISSSSSKRDSFDTEKAYRYSPTDERKGDLRSSDPSSSHGPGVPRMPASYPPAPGGLYPNEREYHASSGSHASSHYPSVKRSPSTSSLTSHRSHPYARQPSQSLLSPLERERDTGRELPRIQLPSLSSTNSYTKYAPEPSAVTPLSSLVIQPPPRPDLHRSNSTGSSGRGFHLPPLHAIDGSGEHGRHSRPHSPIPAPRTVARSPSPGRSPGQYGLRPSYTYDPYVPNRGHAATEYDHYHRGPDPYDGRDAREVRDVRDVRDGRDVRDTRDARDMRDVRDARDVRDPRGLPSSVPRHSHQPSAHSYPQDPYHSHHSHSHSQPHPSSHDHHAHRQPSPRDHREPVSPPLRHLPPDYHTPRQSSHSSFYPPPGYHDPVARSRSHSSTSAQRPRRDEAVEQPGPGQNRRIAHLMSEQKRRESINTGFASLRNTLPNAIPTDSKAIILRKAVSHIHHLEGLLRKAGINPGGSKGPVLTPSSWDEEGERADGGEEEDENGDVEMEKEKWDDERDEEKNYGRSLSTRRKSRH